MTDAMTDDPMLEEEWLASPDRRPRARIVLSVALAAALCLLGGVLIQKHFGNDPGATTASGPGGFPAGGLPEGLPEGMPALGGAAGTTSDSGAGADDQESDDGETVIGEVVRVRPGLWVVEDLGGERHRVVVGDDVDVTKETELTPDGVRAGDAVTVTGSPADARLTAEEVTVR